MGAGEDAQLLLHHRDGEGRVGGDAAGHGVGGFFQVGGVGDVVDDAQAAQAFGGDGVGGEQHLLADAQVGGVEEGEQAANVVGHIEFGGRGGEGGVAGGYDEVAGEGGFAGAAPYAAFDHGDDGGGKGFDLAHQLAQRVAPGQGVEAGGGELLDVMAGRPDLAAGPGTQHHAAHAHGAEGFEGGGKGLDHLLAQGIAPCFPVEGEGGDVVGDVDEQHGGEG